jgi:hypothetical protein
MVHDESSLIDEFFSSSGARSPDECEPCCIYQAKWARRFTARVQDSGLTTWKNLGDAGAWKEKR